MYNREQLPPQFTCFSQIYTVYNKQCLPQVSVWYKTYLYIIIAIYSYLKRSVRNVAYILDSQKLRVGTIYMQVGIKLSAKLTLICRAKVIILWFCSFRFIQDDRFKN